MNSRYFGDEVKLAQKSSAKPSSTFPSPPSWGRARRPLTPRRIPSHHPPQTPGHNPRQFCHLPTRHPHPARRRRSVHLDPRYQNSLRPRPTPCLRNLLPRPHHCPHSTPHPSFAPIRFLVTGGALSISDPNSSALFMGPARKVKGEAEMEILAFAARPEDRENRGGGYAAGDGACAGVGGGGADVGASGWVEGCGNEGVGGGDFGYCA
ncbi:hypothetical protein GMDG_03683 [Pseudogymnoascus destructans 20631-21]|uniref:Uncharacterized protein n=1 Tax=Pseudogymnoascus destructans (strain ATCC MYA-4855 / 20631-21) TaxID=658429 RepID=L8G8D4_PSED2|nr:hypothetical protein GMDG_03683 [Pseudogymnoascus destructans 20631-21]